MQTHFFPPTKSRRGGKKKVQQGEQKYVYRSRSLLRLTDRCEPRLFQDKTLVSWEEAERGFRDAAVMMTLLRESAPASSHSCRGPPVEKRCHYEIHILTDVKKRERALEFGWNSEPLWALGWIFWWRCFAFRLCHLDVFFICFFLIIIILLFWKAPGTDYASSDRNTSWMTLEAFTDFSIKPDYLTPHTVFPLLFVVCVRMFRWRLICGLGKVSQLPSTWMTSNHGFMLPDEVPV